MLRPVLPENVLSFGVLVIFIRLHIIFIYSFACLSGDARTMAHV